jgi:hypothetical protein
MANIQVDDILSGTPTVQCKTKIVCTLGPKSAELAIMQDLLRAGMSVARFNFSHGQGLTLVPISVQLALTLPLSAQLKLTLSPTQPTLTRGCGWKVLNLSSNVSDVPRRSSD